MNTTPPPASGEGCLRGVCESRAAMPSPETGGGTGWGPLQPGGWSLHSFFASFSFSFSTIFP
jgi:hypothetical protein